MRIRIIFGIVSILSPLAAIADSGVEIFNEKCSACHTFAMAQAMLAPVKEPDRPAHLEAFLEDHPPMLNESEKEVVIRALSRKQD